VEYPDELPVVYERFVPDSQVTFPELPFFTSAGPTRGLGTVGR
jgi:hypothetical protein